MNQMKKKPYDRRHFLKVSSLATVGLSALSPSQSLAKSKQSIKTVDEVKPEWRNKQSGMAYRKLGRTQYMVSEVVFGGDPVRTENYNHIEKAIEMGLNYLDTAPAYGRGSSEEGYGKIIKSSSVREKVFVNTKISGFNGVRDRLYREIFKGLTTDKQEHYQKRANEIRALREVDKPGYFYTYWPGQSRSVEGTYLSNAMAEDYAHKVEGSPEFKKFILESIEGSLRRLNTDYLDLVMCPHGANAPEEVNIPEIFETFDQLKKEGKVRNLGVSSHNDPAGVLRAIIENDKYAVAMVSYNILNAGYLDEPIRQAYQKNIGIIGMKVAMAVETHHKSLQPLPEWRVQKLDRILPGEERPAIRAYLWALQNPSVSAVISNMWNEQQVLENLSVAGRKVEMFEG
jgi:aryl-alcohol dehydrogenase-like predicted oxidoreductase